MPCPQTVIHDGVYGTSQPALRGVVLTIVAQSPGSFGTAKGTVRIVDAGNPSNFVDVPAQNIDWDSLYVALDPLPNLPAGSGTGATEQWHVQITIPGETAPCPNVTVTVARATAPACPTQVQVNDGVQGDAANPLTPPATVSLKALSGSFSGQSGTATFSQPVDPTGQGLPLSAPVAATVRLWSANLVQVELPSLPPFTQVAKWALRVTPTGATTPCGPYAVHVVKSLTRPAATLAPTVAVPRGTVVTLTDPAGGFGPLLGAAGTVKLKRTSGTPAEWPVPDSRWSAVAVVFTIPHDLPPSAGTGPHEEWQVELTPDGGQAWAPYGPLKVLDLKPVLLAVQPKVVSEREMVLTAAGLGGAKDSDVQVKVYDLGGRSLATLPGVHLASVPAIGVAAVRCQAPTISQVQASGSYAENMLRIEVDVEVELGSRKSNKMRTTVLLPPPAASVAVRNGRTVTMPRKKRDPELGEVASTEWLGSESRGHAYVYSTGDPTVPLVRGLTQLAADYATTATSASTKAVQEFEAAQKPAYGAKEVATADLSWREEEVIVTLPQGFQQGRIVLFRDDIPSHQVFVGPDLCDQQFLSNEVRGLFSLTSGATELDFGVPLVVTLQRGGGTTRLSDLIDNHGVDVAFSYQVLKNGQPAPASQVSSGGTTGSMTPGQQLNLTVVPEVVAFSAMSNVTTPKLTRAWSLQVVATVSGIPNLADPTGAQKCPPVQVALPPIPFSVIALPVPSLAIFYDGRKFEAAGWPDEGASILINPMGASGGVVEHQRNTLVSGLLSALISNVNRLAGAFPSFPSVGHANVVQRAIDGLARYGDDVDTYTVTSSSNIVGGLGDDWSSMLLVGTSGQSLAIFNDAFSGKSARLRVPSGHWIADLQTMHESWTSSSNSPAPNPGDGLGDQVSSFSWGG